MDMDTNHTTSSSPTPNKKRVLTLTQRLKQMLQQEQEKQRERVRDDKNIGGRKKKRTGKPSSVSAPYDILYAKKKRKRNMFDDVKQLFPKGYFDEHMKARLHRSQPVENFAKKYSVNFFDRPPYGIVPSPPPVDKIVGDKVNNWLMTLEGQDQGDFFDLQDPQYIPLSNMGQEHDSNIRHRKRKRPRVKTESRGTQTSSKFSFWF